jgi:hypothetical protein
MLTPDKDIRQEILDDWEQLEDTTYPEDLIAEWADSQIPIYYGEIIEEWRDMPSSFSDTWQEYGVSPDTTITDLMSLDLGNYYRTKYTEIYEEIKSEKEEESEQKKIKFLLNPISLVILNQFREKIRKQKVMKTTPILYAHTKSISN